MIDQTVTGRVGIVLSGMIVVAGTFAPWLRSGDVDRSSYELFDLVDRLGFSADGPVAWATRLWPFVPLLTVIAVIAEFVPSRRWRRVGGSIGVVAALYATLVAGAIRLAPDAGLIRIRYGTWITLGGALCLLVASVLTVRRPHAAHRRIVPAG